MTQTTTTDRRQKLLNLPIPKGGTLLDAGDEWIWVLRPLTIDIWTQAVKQARTSSSITAALMVIDTLKHSDCPATKTIPETSIGLMMALEDEVNKLVNPVQIEVKKN